MREHRETVLFLYEFYTGIYFGNFTNNMCTIVGRSIINNNHFPVCECLLLDGFYGCCNVGCSVVAGSDNGYYYFIVRLVHVHWWLVGENSI